MFSSSSLSSGYLVGERSCTRRHRGTVDVNVDVDVRRGRWETRAAATDHREASSEDATEGSDDDEDDDDDDDRGGGKRRESGAIVVDCDPIDDVVLLGSDGDGCGGNERLR
jgi:hypothetical protein